jgi:HK97 family phage major capsid protein
MENGDGAAPVRGGMNSRSLDPARRLIDSAHRSGQLPDHAAERATGLLSQGTERDRSLAARWVTTAGSDHYRSAFAKILADQERGHLLWTPQEGDAYRAVAAVQAEMRAMSLTDANGGLMVPFTLDPAILLTSGGSINPLRRISRVVQTVTDQWSGVTSAGATAEWKAEAVQAADGSPTLANPNIPVYFGDAFVPYSFEVGMDAVNFLGELQGVLVDAADQLQATAYTTGTGSGQPTGIITALTGTASVVASAGADVLAAGDVFALQAALPPRFQDRAQWCTSLPIKNLIRQFETTAGALKFPELASGQLLGRSVNELSNMDNVVNATQENYVLLYGDFSQFVIVDRIGTTLEMVPNLFGANGRPTGQRGAFLWFRTGSDSVVDNAFRVLNVT